LPRCERAGPANYMIAGAGCSVTGRPSVTAVARAGSAGRRRRPARGALPGHGPWSATFRSEPKAPWAVYVSFTCFKAVPGRDDHRISSLFVIRRRPPLTAQITHNFSFRDLYGKTRDGREGRICRFPYALAVRVPLSRRAALLMTLARIQRLRHFCASESVLLWLRTGSCGRWGSVRPRHVPRAAFCMCTCMCASAARVRPDAEAT
jgi:hypothetical protein